MTDPRPYREDRDERPAEGPGQTEEDLRSSLPPGADIKPELGEPGDVDRQKPYEESAAPERMVPQPFDPEEEQG